MAKIDLDSLNIEELAALRERIIEKLAEKVASRQVELEAEMERLSQYGKPSKKSQAAPAAKANTGAMSSWSIGAPRRHSSASRFALC